MKISHFIPQLDSVSSGTNSMSSILLPEPTAAKDKSRGMLWIKYKAQPANVIYDDIMIVSRSAYLNMSSELDELRSRVAALEHFLAADQATEPRSIQDSEAKVEIARYFRDHDGEDLYASDLSRALDLDYDQVSRVMAVLAAEGKIGPSR